MGDLRSMQLIAAVAVTVVLVLSGPAHAIDYPVAGPRFKLKTAVAGKQSMSVKGTWTGTLAGATPDFSGATVQVLSGAGEGSTDPIALDPTKWTALPKDKGFKYSDKDGTAGGVRSILLKNGVGAKPGKLKISAGKSSFVYDYAGMHTEIEVEMTIESNRWCGFAYEVKDKNGKISAKRTGAPPGCAIDTIVDAAWLQAHLGNAGVQVIDTRPGSYPGGHIPGAIPLEPTELATTVGGIGFQMVDAVTAESVLDGKGLQNATTVVVYGAPPEYDAARVTWALRYLGHGDVRYLDGGFDGWVAAGGAVDAGDPTPDTPVGYTVGALEGDLRVDDAYVLAGIGPDPYDTPTIQLVDARSSGEYLSGRIPTAVLQQWTGNLAGGFQFPFSHLANVYEGLGLDPAETTVTYCLVGWRASVAWLTLTWLGFDDVRVYDGSWLEWGSGGYPIETS